MFCNHCGKELIGNTKFCIHCGKPQTPAHSRSPRKKYFTKRNILIVAGLILVLAIGGIVYAATRGVNSDTKDKDIASAVVNIYCQSNTNEEDISGGSGTILTEDGLVLTNAHIIPISTSTDSTDISCIVMLPDPTTGSPKEMYYATPIVIPDLSEKYDLAFVRIDDVYYDEEEQKAYGEYPKKFPAYDDEKYCRNENVKLGEPVRIYGYPAISGGIALTITDGIVSSLLQDEGLIITSAKISHGNSGGLAVDQYGCRIGIPSMVSSDESESLGVIISNNLISDFTDEVRTLLHE